MFILTQCIGFVYTREDNVIVLPTVDGTSNINMCHFLCGWKEQNIQPAFARSITHEQLKTSTHNTLTFSNRHKHRNA